MLLVFTKKTAHIAQSAERILGKDKVTGSSPVMGSTLAA